MKAKPTMPSAFWVDRLPTWQNQLQIFRRWLPSRGNVIFTLLVVGTLFWVQNASATKQLAPVASTNSISSIPYQGQLSDSNGVPLSGAYDMVFRLYSESTGGTPLWEEPWNGPNSVQVNSGLFNVMLGSQAALPASVFSGNTNLFLGVAIGTDEEMTPRVQLGSVPFAMQALTLPDSSITTGKIADGAVTEEKLSPSVLTALDPVYMPDYAGTSYTSEITVNNTQVQAVGGFSNTVEVTKRSRVLVIASASLVHTGGPKIDLAVRLRRNGERFFNYEVRHAPNPVDWSQWVWNMPDVVDPGTYTYQIFVSSYGGSGMKIKWHHPHVSIIVMPIE